MFLYFLTANSKKGYIIYFLGAIHNKNLILEIFLYLNFLHIETLVIQEENLYRCFHALKFFQNVSLNYVCNYPDRWKTV